MTRHVLIVDDDQEMCSLVETWLRAADLRSTSCLSAAEALRLAREQQAGAVLTDLRLPDQSGIELCKQLKRQDPELPVIVMTAFGSMDAAIEALRAGAFDFVPKPVEREVLLHAVSRALEQNALRARVRRLQEEVRGIQRLDDLLGSSPVMTSLFDSIERLAGSDVPVLVTGETGSGKELVARALHGLSPRKDGPFVALNCTALPEQLLESELFGHEKGAFTGAHANRDGLFAQARGGTLLLDEVGDLPWTLQPKLLRALESGTVRPLGAEREQEVDVRVVAATNRDLEEAMEDGRFRADLYFRLNVVELAVPPLRARGPDILLLARTFTERFSREEGKPPTRLSEAAAARLLEYDWPGNVRELKNSMQRAVTLSDHDETAVEDLPRVLRDHQPARPILGGGDASSLESLAQVERRYVLHVLQVLGGNRTQAARALGLDRKTLWRKLKSYEAGS